MSNWKQKRIGDFCQVKGGKRLPAGREFATGKTPYPYLRVTDMVNGSIDDSSLVYVTPEIERFIKNYKISKHDIYVTIAGTLGLFGTIPDHLDNAQLTENAAKLTGINFNELDKEYLKYYFNSIFIESQIYKEIGVGGGVPKLALYRIEKLLVKYPTLPVQQKIAKILQTVDGQIEKNEAIIAKYKAIKQGLMQDLFTRGIDADTGKLRPRYQDAPELYKSSPLGMIPKAWDVVKLGNVAHTFSGGTPNRSINGSYGGSIPWVSSGEVNQPYIYKTKESITDFGLSTSSARWIKKDTVLIAMYGATAGQVSMVRIPATSNQAVLAVEESQIIRNFWLYFLLGHIKDRIIFHAQGSGQPNLSKAIIDNTDIVLPQNINEQNEVIAKLTQIDSVIQNESINLDKLNEVKKGLMADLLSGKVRVQVGEEELCSAN